VIRDYKFDIVLIHMKKVIILHGTGSSPDSYWHPYLKTKLEELGHEVQIPRLPYTDIPKLEEQLPYVLDNYQLDTDTILIGHSSGVPLILGILEEINTSICQTIMVSGFFKALETNPNSKLILKKNYNWNRIKKNCKKLIILNSDNDPWGCDEKMGKELSVLVDEKFIFMKGQGHMGSASYKQPYKEFPLLLDIISSKLLTSLLR